MDVLFGMYGLAEKGVLRPLFAVCMAEERLRPLQSSEVDPLLGPMAS